jgi:hypothetical protein
LNQIENGILIVDDLSTFKVEYSNQKLNELLECTFINEHLEQILKERILSPVGENESSEKELDQFNLSVFSIL